MKSINQIFYYGLGGPDKNYKVLNYEFIVSENYSIWLEKRVIEEILASQKSTLSTTGEG